MRVLLFIGLIFHLVLKSQTETGSVFKLAPALGFNACQVHGDGYSGYNKAGVFGGIAINARLSKNDKMSLDLGFYFSQKGARHNPNPEKGDNTYYNLNLNYIDMPLSFRYMLNTKYWVTLGPSIAYLISHNENINYIDRTADSKFNRTELGVNFGLGRKIINNFFVEVRTSNSIMAVRSYGAVANLVFFTNPVARFFNKGFYNNILTLIVSYNIDIKKKSGS
jgi:hypothetical protein